MAWIEFLPAAGLLLAGLLRIRSRPGLRRAVAGALSSAAFAAALTADPLTGWMDASWAAARELLWLLLITAAATAAFAVARRLAIPASLLPWPPPALGIGVAVLQVVLFYGAATHAHTASSVLDVRTVETAVLWLVTLGWPALSCALLVRPIRAYGPGLHDGPVRFAVAFASCGLLALGMAAAGQLARLVMHAAPPISVPVPVDLPRIIEVTASVGLSLIAAAFLIPRLAAALDPARRWASAWLAVRRLAPLTQALEAGAPEWDTPRSRSDASLRHPSLRLYREVIAIRDTSWTLLASVDDAIIAEAVAFARRCVLSTDEQAIAALAEACWLGHALRVRRSGSRHPVPAHDLVILDRPPDEDDGSLRDEVTFLLAVARAWRDGRQVRRFLAALDERHPIRGAE
jgi:hypothetical protein